MNSNAKFIVIDGGDGCGKSTEIKLLKEKYPEFVFTREPGGSPYAEEIREIILHSQYAEQANAKTLFGLFWSARADHLKNTILPALKQGKSVISDRFDSSTYAYQLFGQEAISQISKEEFFLFRKFFLGENAPDLYIYFDVDPLVANERKQQQKGEKLNHLDHRKLDFHKRSQEGYKDFLNHVPHKTIDAHKSIEEIFENLVKVIDDCIK